MAWVLAQRAAWAVSWYTVSMLPDAASRSVVPGAGRARMTGCPAGSDGRECQAAPGLAGLLAVAGVTVMPWLPERTTATVPSGPNEAETACAPDRPKGCDSVQVRPSLVQAASRLADGPVPAWSRATSRPPAWVSRMTCTGRLLRAAGSCGPASCHDVPWRVNTPAVPARAQDPATSGDPAGV